MKPFGEAGHLLRVALVYALGVALFLIVRAILVPHSFGEFGYYRGRAIAQVAALPMHFAGHQACRSCHADVVALKRSGVHAGLHCEACHGPQAAHVANPAAVRPVLPRVATLCIRCHAYNPARPHSFPQIVVKQHDPGGLACNTCHQPHSPLQGFGKKT